MKNVIMKKANTWYNMLTDDEKDNVAKYVSTSSDINTWLANNRDMSNVFGWEHAPKESIETKNQEMLKEFQELHSALSKFNRSEDIVVTRAVSKAEFKAYKSKVGDNEPNIFKRFKSTTPFNGDYSNERTIKYYIPKGVTGAYFDGKGYANEKEFLIDAGQKFKVKFDEKEGLEVYVYANS